MCNKSILYTLLLLLIGSAALTSCVDEPLIKDEQDDGPNFDGYSINVTLTLDPMGGSRLGEDGMPNPMEDIENYINPELLRVLFFDDQDKFLFESKSRWVKKLNNNEGYSSWLVSVPFYQVGNDNIQDPDHNYDWYWPDIIDAITKRNFKIAILANRPLMECFPDLDGVFSGQRSFDNSGPHWTKADTGRDIFELHHAQWDPIYTSKNKRTISDVIQEGYYDFVMDVIPNETDYEKKLLMSSTSCWVDHGPTLNDDGVKFDFFDLDKKFIQRRRRFRHPSEDYPIPMYGVQEFGPLTKWEEGVPFDLSNPTNSYDPDYTYKSISLLRSVVKLELQIDASEYDAPDYITIRYPNVYARCEPMDVWTPTDRLWDEYHGDEDEMDRIIAFGGLARDLTNEQGGSKDANNTDSQKQYSKRLSWFYGCWKEKNWPFKGLGGNVYTPPTVGGTLNDGYKTILTKVPDYPRIFNPCIQRNQCVYCDETTYKPTPKYHRYIVYVGERNLNDPSDLHNIAASGSGKATIMYWMFNLDDRLYSVPIVNYGGYNTTLVRPIQTNDPSELKWHVFGGNPYVEKEASWVSSDVNKPTLAANQTAVQAYDEPANKMNSFENSVRGRSTDPAIVPYPLIRNHVYTIRIGGENISRSGNEVKATVRYRSSRSIKFK